MTEHELAHYEHTPRVNSDELDLLAACMSGFDPRDANITPDDFDEPKHAVTFEAMLRVAKAGNKPSPATVRAALGKAGDSASSWLLDVFGRVAYGPDGPIFATRVRKSAQLRNLQEVSRGIMQRAMMDDADPDDVNAWARSLLDKTAGVTHVTETMAEVLPRVIDQLGLGMQSGLSTPWAELDSLIHGLAPARTFLIAARPGVGKSLMGQNLAWHFSKVHRVNTYFANVEMSAEEITTRTIAQTAEVNLSSMMGGHMTESEWERVSSRAVPQIQDSKIHLCDDAYQTIDTIRQGARQLQRRSGLGLIVIDYIQLLSPGNKKAPREQQVAEISRGVKLMAKELKVPVVAMAQLKRLDGTANRRPTLQDLRESGALEQDADVVLLLHIADELNKPWEAELNVAKARAGKKGTLKLLLATHFATVASAPPLNDGRPY